MSPAGRMTQIEQNVDDGRAVVTIGAGWDAPEPDDAAATVHVGGRRNSHSPENAVSLTLHCLIASFVTSKFLNFQ